MNKVRIKELMQQFGGAMFVPVLLFSFSGLLVGLTIVLKDPYLMGGFANPDSFHYKLLVILEEGGWTIFRTMPIFFCLGIPIGMSKIAPERAVLASMITYLSYNYFIAAILGFWGPSFGVDFSQNVGGTSGLAMIAGIKTLDTNIVGGLVIGGLVTWVHNRFYEKKLPDYLGVFQGTSLVHIVSFFYALAIAFATCMIWPKVQLGINSMQGFLSTSGALGVWIYTFLERVLIPTGLHHFIYGPFIFGPAVVPNGIEPYWMQHVSEIVNMGIPLKEAFPQGGFALHGQSKVFGCLGVALAIYSTAKPENKQKTAALLIPAALTAMVVGITEPLEFTFLFIAPALFVVHAFLAACLATTLFVFGVVGNFGAGLIQFITVSWLFMIKDHSHIILINWAVGLTFTAIWFFVFRTLILKWNVPTPGREDSEMKLYTKADYKEKQAQSDSDIFVEQAEVFLEGLGGRTNIDVVSNCATRLRVQVKDPSLVKDVDFFKQGKAHGLAVSGNNVQVIVGLSVPQVRTQFENLLKK